MALNLIRTALAAAFSSLLIASSYAQSDFRNSAERSAACLSIDSPAARLACLEAAAKAASEALDDTESVPPAPQPSVSAPVLPNPPATAAETESVVATSTPTAPEGRIRPEREAQPERTGILRRILIQPQDAIPLTIDRITVTRRDRRHRFYTSEGEILIQEDLGQHFSPPDALPAEAIVRFGALGSKWLSFEDNPGRRYKVSLVD